MTRDVWQRLHSAGYPGSYMAVYRYIRSHPDQFPRPHGGRSRGRAAVTPVRPVSVRQVSWWLVSAPDKLSVAETELKTAICAALPEIEHVYGLAQAFYGLVRTRTVTALDPWLRQAEESGIAEMASFVFGLRKDYAAVAASLRFAWSNGPVEGANTRVKLVKRQMYGRASFAMLKRRILHPA